MPEEQKQLYPDPETLASAAAKKFVALAKHAVKRHEVFTVALSGGSTPKLLYRILASDYRDQVQWEHVEFFFGDERHVPPDHEESNYRLAKLHLFDVVEPPQENIHRMEAELQDPAKAAKKYEAKLRAIFSQYNRLANGIPLFDLIFLGMGADGHTASLFPGTSALEEKKRWVVANWVEKLETNRITFTYPLLNNAAQIFLLVAGADKADRVAHLFDQEQEDLYPVQKVTPHDGVKTWFLDQAAAAKLDQE